MGSSILQPRAGRPLDARHAVAERRPLAGWQQLRNATQQDQCRDGQAMGFEVLRHSALALHVRDQRQLGEDARFDGFSAGDLLGAHPLVRHQFGELPAPRRTGEAVRRAGADGALLLHDTTFAHRMCERRANANGVLA